MNRLSKQASARIGGILAGAGVVFVGGVLIAAGPAMADNGPHVSNAGQTSIGSGPDGCAGCHRLHSADGADFLLRGASSETTLCTTCHGASGTGATTDVLDGVAFAAGAEHAGGSPVGALRGGGFDYALIGASSATRGLTAAGALVKADSVIPALATGEATTSKHAVDVPGTLWGSGPISATPNAGSAVTLECASCHDPHGNGNYRILRPTGSLGATLQVAPMTIVAAGASVSSIDATRYDYIYQVSGGVPAALVAGQPVSITGNSIAAYNLTAGTVNSTTATTFTIGRQTTLPSGTGAGGTAVQAFANNIKAATGNGTTVTYTTAANHGMSPGQTITITGVNPVAYNLSRVVIASVPSATTFTVTNAASGAYVAGGYITGIPDALGTKVYTQTNYWLADDHNYTGVNVPAFGTSTAFINNIATWCSTCHTRYMSGSNSRRFDSGDAIFKYRHTDNVAGENGRNCMNCHVAHGSNAAMTGQYSSTLPNPGSTTPSASSRLLRVSNRGICNMCHADQ